MFGNIMGLAGAYSQSSGTTLAVLGADMSVGLKYVFTPTVSLDGEI